MIIVSQDKTKIVNFDNLTQIYITRDEEETATFIRYETVDSLYDDLGEYKTEERAKEVLQEITMLFKNEEMFHIRKSTLNNLDELAGPKYILKPVSRPKVFEMPEE